MVPTVGGVHLSVLPDQVVLRLQALVPPLERVPHNLGRSLVDSLADGVGLEAAILAQFALEDGIFGWCPLRRQRSARYAQLTIKGLPKSSSFCERMNWRPAS